jgi:hypothetical protein
MKLSIFAVSALVLSTSFAAVGWADEHQPEVDPGAGEPGAGGAEVGGFDAGLGNKQLPIYAGVIGVNIVKNNIAGTPATYDEQNEE